MQLTFRKCFQLVPLWKMCTTFLYWSRSTIGLLTEDIIIDQIIHAHPVCRLLSQRPHCRRSAPGVI